MSIHHVHPSSLGPYIMLIYHTVNHTDAVHVNQDSSLLHRTLRYPLFIYYHI